MGDIYEENAKRDIFITKGTKCLNLVILRKKMKNMLWKSQKITHSGKIGGENEKEIHFIDKLVKIKDENELNVYILSKLIGNF